jgi:hypothetical protein
MVKKKKPLLVTQHALRIYERCVIETPTLSRQHEQNGTDSVYIAIFLGMTRTCLKIEDNLKFVSEYSI